MINRKRNLATGLMISLQGDGDLGKTIKTDDGFVLQRSPEPVHGPFQAVFGLFQITSYVYARGPKKRFELRPVDPRMQLPAGYASYVVEEFSPYFCVQQALGRSVEAMSRVMRQSISKETLERTSEWLCRPEEYLDNLVAPRAALEALQEADVDIIVLVDRHITNDWGALRPPENRGYSAACLNTSAHTPGFC